MSIPPRGGRRATGCGALRTHVHRHNRQDHGPELGKKLASKANREGGAARFPEPAVQTSLTVDLARRGSYDRLLTALELSSVTTARAHKAQSFSRLRASPGGGQILALGLRAAIHASPRFPQGQALVASCRLVPCAKEAAGTRDGTSGLKIGKADRTWAVSEAAELFLRNTPAGPQYLARFEQTQGPGTALTIRAPPCGRAVDDLFQRDRAVDLDTLRNACESGWARLRPHWVTMGSAWRQRAAAMHSRRRRTPLSPEARCPDPARGLGSLLPLLDRPRESQPVAVGSPSSAPGTNWRTEDMPRPVCSGRAEGPATVLGRTGRGNVALPSPWRWRSHRQT
jgi:hypothetical protein